MSETLRLSLRQSDWISSLWLNVVYLPAKGTSYKVVIFTSGKKLKMTVDYFAGQMVDDGGLHFSCALKFLIALVIGHKVEWREIFSSMKRKLRRRKKKGRPKLRAGWNYFWFPRSNLIFYLGLIGHRIQMPLYNLQWDGKIDRQNLTAWLNRPILFQSICLECLRIRSGTSLPTFRYTPFLFKLVSTDGTEWQAEARLPLIENYANLRNINVPPGIFSSNKTLGLRTDLSDEDEAPEASYPHSSHYTLPSASFSHPTASTPESNLPPRLSLETQTLAFPRTPLPPISFLREQLNPPPQPRSPFSGYFPLTSEDRRALDQIKNHFIKM